ncbi:MAG: aldo/keto reductase, partial [Microbacterium sp.]
AEQVLESAIEAGVRYVDTARAYARRDEDGHNERLIARVLDRMGRRADVLIGTKLGHRRDGDRFPVDASPAALRKDCTDSLRALRSAQLELAMLHFPDPLVPLEVSVGAMAALREEGLIGHVGLCNIDAVQFDTAMAIVPISVVQHRHGPGTVVDAALLERCEQHGVPFLGYSPLGGTRRAAPLEAISPTAARIAERVGADLAAVVLAGLLSMSPSIALVTGARRAESLASSLSALDIPLDDGERRALAVELAAPRA